MEDFKKTIPKEAAKLISQLDGVEAYARIYCRMLPDEEQITGYEDTGSVTRINGKATLVRMMEFDRSRMLYGMNEHACSGLKIIEGAIDYKRLCSGDSVVMAGLLNDSGEYIYESQEFHAGDVIELDIDGTAKEYTVQAIAGLAQSQCMSYSKGGYESAVFAEPVFLDKFPNMDTPHPLSV